MALPKHSQYLARLLAEHFGPAGPRIGAEVGVWRGVTAAHLLASFPQLTLYLVDAWDRRRYDGEDAFDGLAKHNQRHFHAAQVAALSAVRFANARVRLLVMDCCEAASAVPDQSLDHIFLDPAHSKRSTSDAIAAWFPKIRRGGLVCGHDYGYPAPGYEGVKLAVDEMADRLLLDTHVDTESYVWHWRV